MLTLPSPSNGVDDTLAPTTPKFSSGGIIYPPPEIRKNIDRTADFVARNGVSFEARIKLSKKGDPKFSFFSQDDPYHAYYQSRIEAAKLAVSGGDTTDSAATSGALISQDVSSSSIHDQVDNLTEQQQQDAPPEPEPFEFSADLPNITAIDLDVIKLTALFTARKGRAFASALQAKEARSYQFEFLRPSHSLYGYFNRLVEQYHKVIQPPTELLEKVKISAYGSAEPSSGPPLMKHVTGPGRGGARPTLFQEAKKRAEYQKWSRDRRKKADEQDAKERAAFDEIDWQDFVVVGTVELTETDQHIDLPPPWSIREIESMTLAQKKMTAMIMETEAGAEGEQVEELEIPESRPSVSNNKPGDQDMEMENSDDEEQPQQQQPQAVKPAVEEIKRADGQAPIKVRKDYVPRGILGRQKGPQTTQCPVCGQQVLVDEMSEHVRFELLNPTYREQRQELENKKAQQAQLQAGADPTYFLKQFASSRTDIFGASADEEARAKRDAQEQRLAKEKEKIIWDGHARSRNVAKDLYQKNAMLDEQIQAMHRKPQAPAPNFGPQIPDGSVAVSDGLPPQLSSTLPPPPPPLHLNSSTTGLPTLQLSSAEQPATLGLAGIKRPADSELADQPAAQRPAVGGNEAHSGSPLTLTSTTAASTTTTTTTTATSNSAATSLGSLTKNPDGTLHAESLWLRHHPNPVQLQIQLPDSPSLSLHANGQILEYQATATTTMGTIRDWIHSDCLESEIGASKLKIKISSKPATLRQTVAYWNLVDGDQIVISIAK